MQTSKEFQWDAFISHASEDKETLVEPLVGALQKYGLRIWFDRFSLRVGSSLRESIDEGFAQSQFGIVILSHSFFAKKWPKKELNALFSRQVNGPDVILPIWHELNKEDALEYSLLISDMVALRSADGIEAVARSLVQVIRPSAFQFDASCDDAQNALARMREQLAERNPNLECRVTLGSQESDLHELMKTSPEPGLIVSAMQGPLKVDFFAKDTQSYNQDPIGLTLKLTRQAGDNLREAQKTGRRIEFGPEDILDFSSELFQSLMPSVDKGKLIGRRLIIGPSGSAQHKTFRLRLLFSQERTVEEFAYVEFGILQAGEEEIVIESHAPPMPMVLTLTLNTKNNVGTFNARFSYADHEIRKINKAHKALQLLLAGGTLEVTDLESEAVFTVRGARETSVPTDEEKRLDAMIRALYDVAVACNEKILWPKSWTRDDNINLYILHEVVRTGYFSLPAADISLTLDAQPDVETILSLKQCGTIRFQRSDPPDFATVFGRTLDLGPYILSANPSQIEVGETEGEPKKPRVRIALGGPLIYQFERFLRDPVEEFLVDDGLC